MPRYRRLHQQSTPCLSVPIDRYKDGHLPSMRSITCAEQRFVTCASYQWRALRPNRGQSVRTEQYSRRRRSLVGGPIKIWASRGAFLACSACQPGASVQEKLFCREETVLEAPIQSSWRGLVPRLHRGAAEPNVWRLSPTISLLPCPARQAWPQPAAAQPIRSSGCDCAALPRLSGLCPVFHAQPSNTIQLINHQPMLLVHRSPVFSTRLHSWLPSFLP